MQNQDLFESLSSEEEQTREKRQYKRSSTRQTEIMAAVVTILSRPEQERFTTKEIAAEVGVSEACIYRHFEGKADILMGILDFCEFAFKGMFEKIDAVTDIPMLRCAIWKMHKLLAFSEMNPGITRLLTGEALIFEAEEVQERRKEVIKIAEKSIEKSLQLAKVYRETSSNFKYQARANFMMTYVQGRWLAYSQSHFEKKPTEELKTIDELVSIV